jgi:hypothetical protein
MAMEQKKKPQADSYPLMNIRDWMRAIKRHPQFIKDYKEYKRMSASGQDQSVALDWITTKWGYDPDRIVRADKDPRRKSYVSFVTSIRHPPIRLFKGGRNEKKIEFETGYFLYVEINPNGPSKQIKADFNKLLDRYMKRAKKTRERGEKRRGKTYSDPFATYDLYHDKGMSVEQIAEKRYDKNDHRHNAAYHQEWRALQKAKEMINRVTPDKCPSPFPNN